MVRNLEKLGGQTPRFGGSSIQLKNIFPKKPTKFQLCFAPHKYFLPNISSLTMLGIFLIFTTRKRSLGQGNMFTGVCLSTGGVSDPEGVPGPRRVPTRTGKPGKMGRHFPVREKSGNF